MGDIIRTHVLQTSKGEVLSPLPRLNTQSCQSVAALWRDDCYEYSVLTSVVCASLFPRRWLGVSCGLQGCIPFAMGSTTLHMLPAVTPLGVGIHSYCLSMRAPLFPRPTRRCGWCVFHAPPWVKKLPDYLSKFAANCGTQGCRRSLCLDEKGQKLEKRTQLKELWKLSSNYEND